MLGLLLEAMVNCLENTCLEDFGVVCNHEGDLTDFVLILALIDLHLMEDVRCLKNPLLHWTQHFLNNLPNLRFHFKPLKLLHFELGVLRH